MVLVVMAAGLGSRFGGQKQTQVVDCDGNFLIDYSIYDAVNVGFSEILFIVSKENYHTIKDTIGKRIEKFVKVSFVFQQFDDLIEEYAALKNRTKPLGTGNAVLCCKKYISSNFAVINADDFYGRHSFKILFNFLKKNKKDNNFAMVSYELEKTISYNGAVKRGIIQEDNGFLKKICECEISVFCKNIKIIPLEDFAFCPKPPIFCSMNLFGFTPKVFDFLEENFELFLKNANLEKDEFYLPSILTKNIENKNCNVFVLKTDEEWVGLTYKEDLNLTRAKIEKLKQEKIYPKHLWN